MVYCGWSFLDEMFDVLDEGEHVANHGADL